MKGGSHLQNKSQVGWRLFLTFNTRATLDYDSCGTCLPQLPWNTMYSRQCLRTGGSGRTCTQGIQIPIEMKWHLTHMASKQYAYMPNSYNDTLRHKQVNCDNWQTRWPELNSARLHTSTDAMSGFLGNILSLTSISTLGQIIRFQLSDM